MALSQELEDVIAELEKVDPAGAKEYRATLEKYPTLQKPVAGYGLRQSEFDRFMNENKDNLEVAKQQREWYHGPTGKVAYDNALTERDAAVKKQKELEAEVARRSVAAAAIGAKNADGTPVDPAELAEKVMANLKGYVPSKTELEALVAQEAAKLVTSQFETARKDFYEKDFPQSAAWIGGMTEAQLRYTQDTGKIMNRAEFGKFLQENKIIDPAEGYEKFMEPVKREKAIEKEATERADKLFKERSESGGFPGTSGAPSGRGHLEVRMRTKADNDPLFGKDVQLGDNSIAAAAAAELTAEGK